MALSFKSKSLAWAGQKRLEKFTFCIVTEVQAEWLYAPKKGKNRLFENLQRKRNVSEF